MTSAKGPSGRENTNTDLEGDTADERLWLQCTTHNDVAAASFSSTIGTRVLSKTTVSWYRNRDTRDFNGVFSSGELRSNRPDEDAKHVMVRRAASHPNPSSRRAFSMDKYSQGSAML